MSLRRKRLRVLMPDVVTTTIAPRRPSTNASNSKVWAAWRSVCSQHMQLQCHRTSYQHVHTAPNSLQTARKHAVVDADGKIQLFIGERGRVGRSTTGSTASFPSKIITGLFFAIKLWKNCLKCPWCNMNCFVYMHQHVRNC